MKQFYKFLCPLVTFLCCCLFSGSLTAQTNKTKPSASAPSPTLTYKIINSLNGGFGYDVYSNGKLLVHQLARPALPGNEGFATKTAAEKVARLVVSKIKKGEMPPTVTVEEMKKLKAI
jgi:hypothetical protein